MELGIEGRVALVMGASRGIGLGIAGALAAEGARVALASRSRHRLEEAAATIGGESKVFVADTSDLQRLGQLPAEVEAELGPVEILITNTGGPPPGESLQNGIDHWRAAYEDLVLAPRILAEHCLPAMRAAGWGRIVNVASTSIREPIPNLALSNVHRMAALGLFKTLSREVARDGVTVNTVATGRFATDRLAEMYGSLEAAEEQAAVDVPSGRLGQPGEFGDLVAFLCSDRAAFITGAVIPLDGGMLRST